MRFLRLAFFTFIQLLPILNFGQDNYPIKQHKNYCGWSGCLLKPDNPAHFYPYYNSHLCENFDPAQIDFSLEYLNLRTKTYKTDSDYLTKTLNYDFGPIWETGNSEQNGVIGPHYQRIQVHIENVSVSKNRDIYFVTGQTKVNTQIGSFRGTIKLLKVYLNDSSYDSGYKVYGSVFAEYHFREDSMSSHSGSFNGVTEALFYLDSTGKFLRVDESELIADGYWNRTYVGTWTDNKTGIAQKCIWGDYRLPFTFDFDRGDGEMMVNDKYKKNGWQFFGDGSELIQTESGKWELKNKWWRMIKSKP